MFDTIVEGKFGTTGIGFILLDRFPCYRSTSCWLCTALPLDCLCFPDSGIKKPYVRVLEIEENGHGGASSAAVKGDREGSSD